VNDDYSVEEPSVNGLSDPMNTLFELSTEQKSLMFFRDLIPALGVVL
jgi:hypothetical protein